ncbi:hypothetical protein [uncultured Clostridium sp.]|nr:hypothetical protein [uncultured Clostridium sp.]
MILSTLVLLTKNPATLVVGGSEIKKSGIKKKLLHIIKAKVNT